MFLKKIFIMKYLKKFNEKSEYDAFAHGNNMYSPNVSLVKNEYHDTFPYDSAGTVSSVKPSIHYNSDSILSPEHISMRDIKAGWVCYYDGTNIKLCSKSDYNALTGTKYPVGVVVVPSDHLNDGTVRICALSDIGTRQWSIDKQGTSLNIPELKNLNMVTKYDNTDGGTTSLTDYAFLPSDSFTAVTCNSDTGTAYWSTAIVDGDYAGRYIPSPYANDGSKYEDYFYPNEHNALLDFNGIENTEILKNSELTYYTAAIDCFNYHQTNDNGLQWYLPACGELAYVVPRKGAINSSLTGLTGGHAFVADFYWSSSEYSDAHARYVSMDSGYVDYRYKSYSLYVRPFAKVVVSPFSF